MNDIAAELARLHTLQGADFIAQLKVIASSNEFHPVEGEGSIFVAGGRQKFDYENLLNAARKVVVYGYRVFILPNPKNVRTADFIFEQRGIYKMYDLKTIEGKSSVSDRLRESVGQANHILLNMATDYHPTSLARSIKKYFELNASAMEVWVLKGGKSILLKRSSVEDRNFIRTFVKRYNK